MDRREFIEQVAAWSAGASAGHAGVQRRLRARRRREAAGQIARGGGQGEGLCGTGGRVLKPLGGIAAFVHDGRTGRRQAEHRLGPHARTGRQHPSRRGQGRRSAMSRRRGQAGSRLRSHLQRPPPLLHAKRYSGRRRIDRRQPGAVHLPGREEVRARQNRERQVDPRVRVLQGRARSGVRLLHQRADRQAPRPLETYAGAEERHGRDRRQPRRNPQGHPSTARRSEPGHPSEADDHRRHPHSVPQRTERRKARRT